MCEGHHSQTRQNLFNNKINFIDSKKFREYRGARICNCKNILESNMTFYSNEAVVHL